MSGPASAKKIGRPRVDSEAVNVRMGRSMLGALDAFAADQPAPAPTRPEAVRRALAQLLGAQGYLTAASKTGAGRR